jgi:hypothetical protein
VSGQLLAPIALPRCLFDKKLGGYQKEGRNNDRNSNTKKRRKEEWVGGKEDERVTEMQRERKEGNYGFLHH